MHKTTLILIFSAAAVLLALVAIYRIFIYSPKSGCNQELIGTWTTEDGTEKIIISKNTLIYDSKSSGRDDACPYVIENSDYEKGTCTLYPSKKSEMQILGMFEKIEYRDHMLVGSILVSDVGIYTREFRKSW